MIMKKASTNLSLINHFEQFTTAYEHILAQGPVIIGLSGGPDSVALVHLMANFCAQRSIRLIAAYLDHGWRAESAHDADWCNNLCRSLSIEFVSNHIDEFRNKLVMNGSKEEYARNARRLMFEQVANEVNATVIALAHHQNDQEETFFIRLVRGASLTGLTGMKPVDGRYIRPLLAATKQEIIEYLEAHRIDYLIDQTNQSADYLRNRIRNHVIPTLKACDKRFEKTLSTTMARLALTEEYLAQETDKLYHAITLNNVLNCRLLKDIHPIMRHRIILKWLCAHTVKFPVSQAFLDEIERYLLAGTARTHQVNQVWSIQKKHHRATIVNQPTPSSIE